MELIKEIYEKDLGYNEKNIDTIYKLRKASRAIVLNDLGEIALLYVSKNKYHKLPGGGIEAGESIDIALNREVMEEVGTDIRVLGEVGVIIEYRDEFQQLQISHCYYTQAIGEISKPAFTDEEIDNGFLLKWVPLDKAIDILKNDMPDNYVGKFIRNRDLLFLNKTIEILNNIS